LVGKLRQFQKRLLGLECQKIKSQKNQKVFILKENRKIKNGKKKRGRKQENNFLGKNRL